MREKARRAQAELAAPAGGDDARVRTHTSRSSSVPLASPGARNTMLLENGLVVEHVDVRREEREARDRARRDERRARKSSRGSNTIDRLSVHSGGAASPRPQTDSGYGSQLMPTHRASQFSLSSQRPVSVLSGPLSPPLERQDRQERPGIPRAYSQYSLAESSSSPRRSRFLGLSMPFGRSRDSLAPSGMSGSMIDMQ
jgi:hypothetical protein